MATFEDFQKLDIRVGRIVNIEDFPEARKPSYPLLIDLGSEIYVKKSCAPARQTLHERNAEGQARPLRGQLSAAADRTRDI